MQMDGTKPTTTIGAFQGCERGKRKVSARPFIAGGCCCDRGGPPKTPIRAEALSMSPHDEGFSSLCSSIGKRSPPPLSKNVHRDRGQTSCSNIISSAGRRAPAGFSVFCLDKEGERRERRRKTRGNERRQSQSMQIEGRGPVRTHRAEFRATYKLRRSCPNTFCLKDETNFSRAKSLSSVARTYSDSTPICRRGQSIRTRWRASTSTRNLRGSCIADPEL